MPETYSAAQKTDMVVAILRQEKSVGDVVRQCEGVTEADVARWTESFLKGGRRAIKSRPMGQKLGVVFIYILPSLLVAAAVLVSVIMPVVDYPRDGDWAKAASKGDFWSGHLASGCTLASVVLFFLAIMLQREELKAQREELELTREEMKQSRAVAETQLQLARETNAVTQILECTRLLFEAEISRGATQSIDLQGVANEHLARIDDFLEVLFTRSPLTRDLKDALLGLLGSQYGVDPAKDDETTSMTPRTRP